MSAVSIAHFCPREIRGSGAGGSCRKKVPGWIRKGWRASLGSGEILLIRMRAPGGLARFRGQGRSALYGKARFRTDSSRRRPETSGSGPGDGIFMESPVGDRVTLNNKGSLEQTAEDPWKEQQGLLGRKPGAAPEPGSTRRTAGIFRIWTRYSEEN